MSQRDPVLRLPSWLIAASLAVVVVATLTYFITTSNDNTDEASPQEASSETDDPSKSPEATDTASPDKSDKSSKPKATPKPKKSDKPDKSDKKPKNKKKAKKQPVDPSPDATVDVYNNSGITNLAASASEDVRSTGFSVGGVDNWYGAIPATTVYYPPGMEDQARLLAESLGVSRQLPAVDPMSSERLSLILTAAI